MEGIIADYQRTAKHKEGRFMTIKTMQWATEANQHDQFDAPWSPLQAAHLLKQGASLRGQCELNESESCLSGAGKCKITIIFMPDGETVHRICRKFCIKSLRNTLVWNLQKLDENSYAEWKEKRIHRVESWKVKETAYEEGRFFCKRCGHQDTELKVNNLQAFGAEQGADATFFLCGSRVQTSTSCASLFRFHFNQQPPGTIITGYIDTWLARDAERQQNDGGQKAARREFLGGKNPRFSVCLAAADEDPTKQYFQRVAEELHMPGEW